MLRLVLAVCVFILGLGASTTAKQVCVRQTCFAVVLAQTPEERARGLMHRTVLGQKEGMLFIFDREEIHPFWMKNTVLSLDILWVSAGRDIVHIETRTLPMSERRLVPGAKALYVLEVIAGTVERLGVKKGDRLSFVEIR